MMASGVQSPTAESAWQGTTGGPIGDALLEWPPDLSAFAKVIFTRDAGISPFASDGNAAPASV
jgi:hypothetical protein